MKKNYVIAGVALLIAVFVYQGTLASYREDTNIHTPISAGYLGIEILDNGTVTSDTDIFTFENAMPGSSIQREIAVKNAKDKELYLRITLTRYWSDEAGNKLMDEDASLIHPITNNTQDWIIVDDKENSNSELLYYYYKKPLSAGQITSLMMNEVKLSEDITNQKFTKYHANIKLEAEAIQSAGAQDAITSQWGIDITFDDNKNIISISE